MRRLRIAMGQIDAVVGEVAGNVERVIAGLAKAEEADADLAIFPELVLTGYPPEDLLASPAFLDESMQAIDLVRARTRHCAAIVGFVETDDTLHNAAAVMAGGVTHGIWRKRLLPNYGVFDEQRWFVPGAGPTPLFEIAGVRVGILICEDIWFDTGPMRQLATGGVELVVALNASPYRLGALGERQEMLARQAKDARCTIVYVNLVGGQDELIFDGGSMVIDPSGVLTGQVPQFIEAIEVVDIDIDVAKRPTPRRHADRAACPVVSVTAPRETPHAGEHALRVAPAPTREQEAYEAIVLATRDYVEKNRFSEVLIGLSGGIDSALVASIAADALGSARVHGVALPSRYSSAESEKDAATLSANLGIEFRVISIEPAHEAFLSSLAPSFSGLAPDLTEENLQARIRGVLLMALSNKFGWLVLTTGNKSETAVGYSTLYGDTAGGFAVIKDVPKTLVYGLARYRNALAGTDLIPEAILDKPPSAELRPGQRDADSLPPYEVLDPILEGYVERNLTLPDLVAAGHDEGVVRRIIDLVDHAEYKRRQAPPGARITSRAFGKDRRMPITNHFRNLSSPVSERLTDG